MRKAQRERQEEQRAAAEKLRLEQEKEGKVSEPAGKCGSIRNGTFCSSTANLLSRENTSTGSWQCTCKRRCLLLLLGLVGNRETQRLGQPQCFSKSIARYLTPSWRCEEGRGVPERQGSKPRWIDVAQLESEFRTQEDSKLRRENRRRGYEQRRCVLRCRGRGAGKECVEGIKRATPKDVSVRPLPRHQLWIDTRTHETSTTWSATKVSTKHSHTDHTLTVF
jgi:hypothetical protein